jgi:eukaryotic-like serine/threonine-protein kinase
MADPIASVREALQDRYAIQRELGRGGMATVYLANDIRHDRPVALKVLHPELAATLGPERFQREIRFAARLQHPHILTVLDSGTAGRRDSGSELLWFTMPFVEGESLRDRIRRERQLPVDVALQIGREAARALDYAHQHGIVHRDIKPENILLTSDGTTLVADFGIARALGGDDRLTQTGLAIGTPAYMSPEQAAGDKGVDARTDVYSLGAVLYEMLAGEPPFTGPTVQAMIARRLSESPPSVRRTRPTVPEGVDQAIQRALAPVPADRFGSAAELARALQASGTTQTPTAPSVEAAPATPRVAPGTPPQSDTRRRRPVPVLAITLIAGFLLGLGVLFAWRRNHPDAPSGDQRRIAVLPFENLGDTADAYFADGMTDEIRGRLAALRGLQVIAHQSAAEYKGSAKSYREIGSELGVDYLLVGKVRWEKADSARSRVRVSPELIDVASSSTRWQQPFDAVLSDVFQVQGKIAGEVAQALDVAIGQPERERLEERPTRSLAAWDAFLRGEEASKRMVEIEPTALGRAADAYERAVALDSGFVQAWTRVSQVHSSRYANGVPTPEGAARARAAAERALALAPDAAEPRLALGTYYDFVTGEYAKALEQFALGRRADPNNAELLSAAALSEQSLGRWENALDFLKRAEVLDPRSPQVVARLARSYLWLRRHDEAIAAADRGIALAPSSIAIHQTKAMAMLGKGDLPGARAVLRAVPATVDPTELVVSIANYWDMAWVLDDEQQRLFLRLGPSTFGGDRFGWAIAEAQTYAYRGDLARARTYADSAVRASGDVLTNSPDDAQRRVLLGVALAYAGRKAEAIREGERGVSLLPISKDAYTGPYLQHQLVRIYILTGETQKAVDLLTPLLEFPYYLSPGWLRVDPSFDPLRNDARFKQMVAGST